MIWKCHSRVIDLSRRGLIMGILNVTPDSFSDGGRFFSLPQALEQARRMIGEGADIIDIGGESTRPGAVPVPEEEEIARVLPVLQALRRAHPGVLLSIDTMKPAVARRAVAEGADMINDVGGLQNPDMLQAAAECGAGLVVMHMRGNPATMQHAPRYTDVVAEVKAFFEERMRTLQTAGIAPERVVFDPGIGFGKTLAHNLALIRQAGELVCAERPLLYGVSRKSFITKLMQQEQNEDFSWATVALTIWLREAGARIFRVHEAGPNAQALRMTEAIREGLGQKG